MNDQFSDIAGNMPEQEAVMAPRCTNGQLYTVQPGDSLFFIARRNNISLQSLINANPQIVDPNSIFPGQVICIPAAGPGITCPGGQVYRVVRGDSMWEIARRFGITLDALIRANPQIPNPSEIFPGQEICIPVPLPGPTPTPQPVSCPNGYLYTVKSGDSLYEIARANNISLTSLIAANPQIPDPNRIMPGQVICVPKMVEKPIPLPEAPMPSPVPPVVSPLPMPCPVPPVVSPLPMPVEPIMPMPCPPGMVQTPVYVVIPWDECPHRPKKRKHHHRDKKCCK